MTRQLPAAAPPRARRTFTMPWTRTRVVAAHPVRTDVVLASPSEARNIADNPQAEILSGRYVGGRFRMVVRYTDRNVSVLPTGRRWPVKFEGLRGWAAVMLAIAGAVGALVGGGLALWSAYGDNIMHGLKITGGVLLGLAVAAAILAAMSASKGGCSGLHCPGCSKH